MMERYIMIFDTFFNLRTKHQQKFKCAQPYIFKLRKSKLSVIEKLNNNKNIAIALPLQ